MKKALGGLVIIIILILGVYFVLQPSGAVAPAPEPASNVPAHATQTGSTVQKPPANVGATGVYDPNAPKGSAAECAACGQYNGSEKAQCLVALHC